MVPRSSFDGLAVTAASLVTLSEHLVEHGSGGDVEIWRGDRTTYGGEPISSQAEV